MLTGRFLCLGGLKGVVGWAVPTKCARGRTAACVFLLWWTRPTLRVVRFMGVFQQSMQSPLDDGLETQRRQGQKGQERRDGKGGHEVVFVVENLDVQRQRVGSA